MKFKFINMSSKFSTISIYMNFSIFVTNFLMGSGNILREKPKMLLGIMNILLSFINLYFAYKFFKQKYFTFDYKSIPSRIAFYNKHFHDTIEKNNEIYSYKKLKKLILKFFKENKEFNLVYNNCSEFTLETANKNIVFLVYDFFIKFDNKYILMKNHKELFKFYSFCEKKMENI